MESTWNVVHDCDSEDGSPTCWAKRIDHPTYGKFVWISQYDDRQYAVEVIPVTDVKVLAVCKSLSGAKRWAPEDKSRQCQTNYEKKRPPFLD